MNKSYNKITTYEFEVNGEGWAITYFDDKEIHFEETRKNGQEDCHMSGMAQLIDRKWKLTSDTRECIEMYSWRESPDLIEEYFNKHGVPA